MDCKEVQPVHPKGDQSWVFIRRTDAKAETPILPYGERQYLQPSFDIDCLLALWPLLLLVSLVTCKVWSFDLYLKKLPCKTLYTFAQNSIKHPCSTRDLSLCVLPSLSLSLYFWLIPWSAKDSCVTQGILASFLLSLSYRQLRTTKFWSIKGPQQVAPRTGAWYTQHFGRSDSGPVEAVKYKDMGQTAGKPPHFSTLLHRLFKVKGLSVLH